MFRAIKQLCLCMDGFRAPWGGLKEGEDASLYADGYRRFVRCVYDAKSDSLRDVFRRLAGDGNAFDMLAKGLESNGFAYSASFNGSEVKNMESSGISLTKSIVADAPAYDFNMYNHDYIGLRAEFCAIMEPSQKFYLAIQKPREVLAAFSTLSPVMQRFIVLYHAKCDGCGYCTQRSKGKSKPFTICAEYGGKTVPLCPINHVYSYCWSELNSEPADGIIAYLKYQSWFCPAKA